jgi:hypothetical protein
MLAALAIGFTMANLKEHGYHKRLSDVLVVTTQCNKNKTDHGLNTFGNLRIGYQFGRISSILFQNLKTAKLP